MPASTSTIEHFLHKLYTMRPSRRLLVLILALSVCLPSVLEASPNSAALNYELLSFCRVGGGVAGLLTFVSAGPLCSE